MLKQVLLLAGYAGGFLLIGYAHEFEGVTAPVKSGVLLYLWLVVHPFVSDIRLFSVAQGSLYDYWLAHLAYGQGLEVSWDNESCAGQFPFTYSNGKVLHIPSREVTSARRNVDDIQAKRFIRSVPVKFKAGP